MAAALAGSSLAGCGGKADNSAPETKPAGSEADNGELHRQRERQSSRPSVRQMHLLR